MEHASHRGEQYDYLLSELDGARTTFFGLETLVLAFAGLALVGLQLGYVTVFGISSTGSLVLCWPTWQYSTYIATIKAKLKRYLWEPDKYDLWLAVLDVIDKEPIVRSFRVHKRHEDDTAVRVSMGPPQ